MVWPGTPAGRLAALAVSIPPNAIDLDEYEQDVYRQAQSWAPASYLMLFFLYCFPPCFHDATAVRRDSGCRLVSLPLPQED